MTEVISQLNAALAGRYAIEREVGAGGMATVYLARDVRHQRKVAVKVVRPELGAVLGGERFLAEIQVTANLQHPNLLPLFDSGEAGGHLFYVMPYVEGESLRALLMREKQLPLERALHIAVAIAGALDYAHRRGVVHRDLKPENILLHDNEPLIADFGIALAVSNAGGARITQTGISLGTPQYMSPEQATGDRSVDGRSDIYSLAAVTYEMLTGEAPHSGSTAQAVIAKLLTEDVRPLTVLRRAVPPHIDAAVRRALQKLPADRFATAHEYADAIQGRSSPQGAAPPLESVDAQVKRLRITVAVAGGALALAAAALAWFVIKGDTPDARGPTSFVLNFEPGERIASGIGLPFAISADGQAVTYAASRGSGAVRLYLRQMSDLRAIELKSTEGAWSPTFSPDGRWIAFIANNQLKKVAVAGGEPVALAQLSISAARGLSWSVNGKIAAGDVGAPLLLVGEGGWDTTRFRPDSAAAGELGQRWPLLLPDGDHVVYSSWNGTGSSPIWIGSLRNGRARSLGVAGTMAIGLVQDWLIYGGSGGGLMAVRIDAQGLRSVGAPIPLPDRVAVDPVVAWARGALSAEGSFLYQSGLAGLELSLVDVRTRQSVPLLPGRRPYSFPRFSPDGRRIAMTISEGNGSAHIWILDRAGGALQRLTEGEATANDRVEWTPDGKRVLYRATNPTVVLKWQAADRSAAAEVLQSTISSIMQMNEGVISPNGQWLVFRVFGGGQFDFRYRRMTGDTASRPLLVSPGYESAPRFSPDGNWLAYSSDESGMRQVFVTPFPGPGPRFQVSLDGGQEPVWAPDGMRLYYVRDPQIIAAAVTLAPRFAIGQRTVVLESGLEFNYVHANYDVAPDGQHLLVLKRDIEAQAIVVRGWGDLIAPRLGAPR